MMTFGPWQHGSADALTILSLLTRDDIWDLQRIDGRSKEDIPNCTFPPGTYYALFRDTTGPIGYILFIPHQGTDGTYQQHTAFVEFSRGQVAVRLVEQAIRSLFIETNAINLITFCPTWHKGSSSMARHMGADLLYTAPRFAVRDGQMWEADVYGMTILQWAFRNHLAYAENGHRWHEEIFASLEPHHEDDEGHNGFLGIAMAVGRRRPHVGIGIYNAWAELAGYQPATLIWADRQGHSFIDIGNAMVLNGPERVIAAIPRCQQPPPSSPPPQP